VVESMEFDAAVEVGIAAFCAGTKPPSEDEVWERLTGAGVEPWLAERLLIFLPMAYTRRLLPEVSYQDGLLIPGGRVSLSAEPVFLAALRRAQQAGHGELVRIGVYSAEFGAISKLADGGPVPPDATLTEVRLVRDLAPVEQGDGGVPSPRALLEGILREHGVTLGGETKVHASLLIHPAPAGVAIAHVDFAVSHPALAEPLLVGTVGDGTTWREAITEAASEFDLAALHPITDGLMRPSEPS